MMSSSITLSLVGVLVGWMTKASTPRTFSPISTKLSPSLKRVTLHLPSGVSRYWPIDAASAGLALPEKRHTFLNTRTPRRGRGCASRSRRVTQCQRSALGGCYLPVNVPVPVHVPEAPGRKAHPFSGAVSGTGTGTGTFTGPEDTVT